MNKALTIRKITRKGFDYIVSGALIVYIAVFVAHVSHLTNA